MIGAGITHVLSTLSFLLLGLATDLCNGGSYCFYIHEDYYTINQKYCESGCCRDFGDDDEICCFAWTVGVILGISFACIGFIAVVAFGVICCYSMKKRSRNGQIINPAPQPAHTNMVVYTASAYPHPPSAFYPDSRYPGHAVAPPPYTAATQPAYPPTQMDQAQTSASFPTGLYGQSQSEMRTPSAPGGQAQPTSGNLYGGYGTGQS